MRTLRHLSLFLFLIISFITTPALAGHGGPKHEKAAIEGGETVNISGIILDSHKEPVGEAEVEILFNGKEMDRVVTAENGKYVSRFQAEKGKVVNFNG